MKENFCLRLSQVAFAALAPIISTFGQMGDAIISDSLQNDEIKQIVYELPYMPGKKVSIVQGYNGWWSHQHSNALDFLMRKGEIICAARSGIVQGARSDSQKGGASYKFISDGNYVIIKHDDSTSAAYWHMLYNSVMVKPGDTVQTGQQIGRVGSTGFSSGPHLHFEVYYFDGQGNEHTVKTVFSTTRGIKKPRAWHFYKKPGEI